MLLRVFILRGRFRECYFLLINSAIRNFGCILKTKPRNLKKLVEIYVQTENEGRFGFWPCRGRDFIILLDISVHSLLITLGSQNDEKQAQKTNIFFYYEKEL